MVLPSLLDVLVVLTLVAPGFISLSIAKYYAVIERKLSEFELGLWSIFLSLVILGIFSTLTNLTTIDGIRDRIFDPTYLTVLILLSIDLGCGLGVCLDLYVNRGKKRLRGDPWDIFFDRIDRMKGRDVVVFTSDSLEFKGWIGPSGREDDKHELILRNPVVIVRDPKWNVVTEFTFGESLLFKEDDIKRVVMLPERS